MELLNLLTSTRLKVRGLTEIGREGYLINKYRGHYLSHKLSSHTQRTYILLVKLRIGSTRIVSRHIVD